ncbi:hypothetical protein GCM10009601_10330 [Streptomyces thermospinosisporus]|uniref:Uncharacterized protein n=1 Tax=Streptomyces thermospinosisporus TaxID=161482 RepID=A0ABN1YL30_9ACTN
MVDVVGVRIAVDGDHAAMQSLWDWLRQESALRGRVRYSTPAALPGQMGSVGELVVEGLVSGVVSAVTGALGQALTLWLTQRRAAGRAPTTVRVTTTGGRQVTITTAEAEESERLLRLALEGPPEPPAPATDD